MPTSTLTHCSKVHVHSVYQSEITYPRLMLYTFRATGTHKQVYHQQVAPLFKYKALLHVPATVRSHLQGTSVFKDIYTALLYSLSIINVNERSSCTQYRVIVHDVRKEHQHVGFTPRQTRRIFTFQDVWIQQLLLTALYNFNIILYIVILI